MARISTYKWPGSICTHGQDLYVQMARISTYKWLGFFNSTGLHLNNLNHRLVNLHCVHHTAKSDSAMYIVHHTAESIVPNFLGVKNTPYLQYASLWGDHLRGLHHTAKSISVVCIAQQSQSLQCASHPVVKLHTAE